ncbi:9722_t:CDS:2, partial [Entrophospora sp. SA101]
CSELSFCLGGIPGIGCVSSWLFLAGNNSLVYFWQQNLQPKHNPQ